MRHYPEYKESGVDWIGEIPAHWKVRRNKRIFSERDDRSGTGEEELLTVSHITGVSPRAEKNVGMFLAETLEGYKHCSVGDLVINTMWAWMGALGISEFDGIVSPSYNVYQLKNGEYLPKYYDYLYRTPNHVSEIIRWSKGIWHSRLRLYPDAFFRMFTITPPFREQTQIANFLDRKTGQIDELIHIKERQVELLQEQRIALINQAVTKGVDSNVEMKPSQLEWIGQIPEHWEVIKFRYLSQESRRKNDDEVDREMLSLSSYTGIQVKQYEYENTKRSKQESLTYLVVEPNQLVVNPMWQIQRGISVSYLHGIVSPGYRVYYIDLERLIPQYLHYLMRSDVYVDEYNKHIRGLTTYNRSVRKEDFEETGVLLPPKQEQTQIANFLDHKTKQIDELIAIEGRKIELLKEYRQSLISEAVTGKIDVRNEA